jgi:pyroglutamyl-peptidase
MNGRTLVTGFGPFQSVQDNPSATLARRCERPFQIIDVSFDTAEDFIFHLDPDSFDRLLMIGVAAARTEMTPELFARNTYGAMQDVNGKTRSGAIVTGGPLLLQSTLWDDSTLAELLSTHLGSLRTSLNAGNYLCNFTLYKALQAFPSKRVGFLHVPAPEKLDIERQQRILADILQMIESE